MLGSYGMLRTLPAADSSKAGSMSSECLGDWGTASPGGLWASLPPKGLQDHLLLLHCTRRKTKAHETKGIIHGYTGSDSDHHEPQRVRT